MLKKSPCCSFPVQSIAKELDGVEEEKRMDQRKNEVKLLPLTGIRVLELSLAVMGPTAGMILADMGAEVIRIEPTPHGDETRRLKGFGTGFFPAFNRNKRSIILNLKSPAGKEIMDRLIETADILVENYAPGTIDRLGFGYDRVSGINPRLIFCSLKGFMPGPYEKRPALDEMCQMMGGLAYMTGPAGRPLRAGASVLDIMGGSYGVIGILTALYERERTGRGQHVLATLFESVVMLMAPNMAMTAITGQAPPPMPERGRSWSVYDLFETSDQNKVFVGITSDAHWQRFCQTFGYDDLLADHRLATNNRRVEAREWFIPELNCRLAKLTKAEIMKNAEDACIPFSPIARPDDLFNDPHLNASGGLLETTLLDGRKTKLPRIPVRLDNYDFGLRYDPPVPGEGGEELLLSLGLNRDRIVALKSEGIIGPPDTSEQT
jgi:crotonobetainyl-CoA:carnitine CoA-transferase CaiB-like acyl-CoA transferase